MSVKPGDFFIGLVDFFAILLPGAIFTFLLWDVGETVLSSSLPPLDSSAKAWTAFVVASYVLGHALHQAGSVLDRSYDALYVKGWKRRKGEERLLTRTRELMRGMLGGDATMTSAYSWAGSYVRTASDAATRELERMGAESKFFRSLALVLAFALVTFVVRGLCKEAAGALLLTAFSYWRFCRRRWDASQTAYEYFILLTQRELRRP